MAVSDWKLKVRLYRRVPHGGSGIICDHFIPTRPGRIEECGCELGRDCPAEPTCPDYISEADWDDSVGQPFHKERFWLDDQGDTHDWDAGLWLLGLGCQTRLADIGNAVEVSERV